jgi:hypothetical protein
MGRTRTTLSPTAWPGGTRFAVSCAVLCTAWLLACPGCWQSKSVPETIRVHGKVTYQGKPVTTGRIVFQPVGVAQRGLLRPATGVLQPDGSYELSTFAQGDGAVPGRFGVGIVSTEGGPTPENMGAPVIWLVPRKYSSHTSSGLTAAIPADAPGPLEFTFDLKD